MEMKPTEEPGDFIQLESGDPRLLGKMIMCSWPCGGDERAEYDRPLDVLLEDSELVLSASRSLDNS